MIPSLKVQRLLGVLIFVMLFDVPSTLSRQVEAQEAEPQRQSRLYVKSSQWQYFFLPNGTSKTHVTKSPTLIFDLSYTEHLLRDSKFFKAMKFKNSEELGTEIQRLNNKAKEFAKRKASIRSKSGTKELLDEWNRYLETYNREVDSLLTLKEKEALQDYAVACQFYALGFEDFVKSKTEKVDREAMLHKWATEQLLEEFQKKLIEIEAEVMEILIDGIDENSAAEIKVIIDNGISNRTPLLTILWNSLIDLENESENESTNSGKSPLLCVNIGRLSHLGHLSNSNMDLIMLLASVGQKQSDRTEVDQAMKEIINMMTQSSPARQEAQDEIRRATQNGKQQPTPEQMQSLKELRKKEIQDREKRIAKITERFSDNTKQELNFSRVAADFGRIGFETAFFSTENRKLLEFPPSNQDLKTIRENAPEARKLLEDRVHDLVKNTYMAPLKEYFETGSPEIKWLERKYVYQIPPVEIILFQIREANKK